MTCTGVAK